MKAIEQQFTISYTYRVHFTDHLFSLSNPCLSEVLWETGAKALSKVLVVLDQGLVEAHPSLQADIATYLGRHVQLVNELLVVPGGEVVKNDAAYLDQVLNAVDIHGIDRHSYILAIGGGAVLDMVGYAASIAHRGVRHIRIPSTVLSQNDSGVGVKNGVNQFGKKNFIGNFAPPLAVINDLHLLTTLEDRDWRSGISEAIKVALIKDAPFFARIEADATKLSQREMPAMTDLIYRCAELHMEHIGGGDPFEKGSSRPLDFGHWAAHKLEQLTDFRIRHGEAVAIGIALDVVYAMLIGMLAQADCERILKLIEALGFRLWEAELTQKVEESDEYELLAGLREFQEHLGGRLTIMLIEAIGKGVEVHEMEAEKVIAALQFLKKREAARLVGEIN